MTYAIINLGALTLQEVTHKAWANVQPCDVPPRCSPSNWSNMQIWQSELFLTKMNNQLNEPELFKISHTLTLKPKIRVCPHASCVNVP